MDVKPRLCGNCNRTLQVALHDHCVFCGAPIPEQQQLSPEQKKELKKEMRNVRKPELLDLLIDVKGRFCSNCNRALQLTLHDHCVFCGAAIPAEQQLSPEQKKELKIEMEKLYVEKKVSHRESRDSPTGDPGVTGTFGGDFGDCGGDGGDGGGC